MNDQTASGRWSDLGPRLGSAIAMLALGGVEIWIGGRAFHMFVGAIVGLMLWELIRMLSPERRALAVGLSILGGLCIAILPEFAVTLHNLAMLFALVLLGCALGYLPGRRRKMGMAYAVVVLLGGFSLILLRDELGIGWVAWLVGIVIASDVAGYFAGKAIGGPKFWPAISPKKTWSGTAAGWIGAALVGWMFSLGSGITAQILILSVILAFAAQLGDIAESAIKRRSGVKDSSSLIPGHGGVLDRFDGLLGAALALLVIAALTGVPKGLL